VTKQAADTGKRPLKIATIPLPPWGYKMSNGEPAGIAFEWANAIAKRMGRNAENRILPMQRLFKEIEFGRADFSIMLRTPYSQTITVPVANVGIPFRTIVWPRKGLSINSYNDLKGVPLSMARGLKVGGRFSEQKNLSIMPSVDYAQSMQMFIAQRVDAIIGTQQSLLYNAFKFGINPSEAFGEPFELARLEGWVQASQDYIEREGIQEIQKASLSLIEDGTFERIFKKYIQRLLKRPP